jgi:hypothetical protein
MLKINGLEDDALRRAGVRVAVLTHLGEHPALRNAFTSSSTRLSLTLARTRSMTAGCEQLSNDYRTYYRLRGPRRGGPGMGEGLAAHGGCG